VALGSGFGVAIGIAIGVGLGVRKKGYGMSKRNFDSKSTLFIHRD
jgi:hypothetical protein